MLTKTKPDEKNFQKNTTTSSYWITTFGCQMNKADSEKMAGTLEKMGYTRADHELNADLVCTIHAQSEIMRSKKFIAF